MSAADEIAKLEGALLSVLSAANVSERALVLIAKADVLELGVFLDLAGSKETLRTFLKDEVGLNQGRPDFIDCAKILGAWGTSSIQTEVTTRVQAERTANHLPP